MPNVGVVTNCNWCSVYAYPQIGSEIICRIPGLSEVEIDEDESTDDFYKIYTETSIEGFCAKKYIAVPL